MKAIIVAAGRGRRLGPETADIPKCMVQVGGRPILHRQLDAFSAAGITDFVIVRGYLGDRITAPGFPVRFIENPDWANNNILTSLSYALDEMSDGFLFSYSDIVFAPAYAQQVEKAEADVALVIDRRWQETYVGRVQHPISEAELASVKQTDKGSLVVDRVGKTVVSAEAAIGEFIGLAKFSASGAVALQHVWADALSHGIEQPFGRAAHLRQAYLSDALNALADRGMPMTPVFIDGGWREIDTEEDLSRAHDAVAGW
ncbi:MAG: phosphocholine cytidylyltransferase family protein [Deltaproteobacteria bacterium]|nr:phosphocholine cytidylyltransferase family protein [Deltaproteobacteria bacterium]